MQRREKNGIVWLEFELLVPFPELVQGVFLRHGGVSKDDFSSLNLSFTSGDVIENVQENLKRVSDILEIPQIARSTQVHGTLVREVANADAIFECDGLMTNQPGLGLLAQHADCQVAIFYDPVHKALATVHSGWRGSVQNIYAETIKAMNKRYGSQPEDLRVCISPSLGPESAEFINYETELLESFWKHQTSPNHFDFWAISQEQLLDCGIQPQHIEIARICTYANPDDYFSYRRNKMRGRHGTLAALR